MTCPHGWFRNDHCPTCAKDHTHLGYSIRETDKPDDLHLIDLAILILCVLGALVVVLKGWPQ